MATDQSPAIQPAMEDILSSIRSGVEEETAKVGNGSADLIDAAAAQDGEDDVFDLSADDIVAAEPAAASEDDELIDIAAFGSSGEAKPMDTKMAAADLAAELLGEAAVPVVTPAAGGGASDEFDRLLAEISQEQQQQVAAAEVSKQALMDEEEPLGAPEVIEEPVGEGVVEDEVVEESLEETVTAAAMAELAPQVVGVAPSYSLGMVESAEGVQIALPAEVLAMALRPMVQDWLAKNLPGVVEKLVKEEISKLTQA